MLLRSASSPLLSSIAASLTSPSIEPSPEAASSASISKFSFSVKSKVERKSGNISRTLSDSHLHDLLASYLTSPRRRRRCLIPPSASLSEFETSNSSRVASRSMNRELLMLQSNESKAAVERSSSSIEPLTLVMGDGCAGGGGRVCNGRRGNGDGENSSDPNESTDKCYKEMIEADPSNSLILGNYARFLKEVIGDCVRALEYCERAILVNPSDAGVLCLYAEIIWQTTKDTSRAEAYFDRAVKAAPDDCYVMASYAQFLWELEEDEEQEENVSQESEPNKQSSLKTTPFHWNSSMSPPAPHPVIAASS